MRPSDILFLKWCGIVLSAWLVPSIIALGVGRELEGDWRFDKFPYFAWPLFVVAIPIGVGYGIFFMFSWIGRLIGALLRSLDNRLYEVAAKEPKKTKLPRARINK